MRQSAATRAAPAAGHEGLRRRPFACCAASVPRGPGRSFPAAVLRTTRRTLHPRRTEEAAHRLFQLQRGQHAAVERHECAGPRRRSRNGSPARRALCRTLFRPRSKRPWASLAQWRPARRRQHLLAATDQRRVPKRRARADSQFGQLGVQFVRGGGRRRFFRRHKGGSDSQNARQRPLASHRGRKLSRRGCGSPVRQAINPGTQPARRQKLPPADRDWRQALRDCQVARRPHIRTTGPRLRRPAIRSTSRSPH